MATVGVTTHTVPTVPRHLKVLTTTNLDSSSWRRDVCLNGRREVCSGKLLFLSLSTFDHWDGKQLLVDVGVAVQDVVNLYTLITGEMTTPTRCYQKASW